MLTTHYMEEAEALCDHLAIMSRGTIVAKGTCAALISALGATMIRFRTPEDLDLLGVRSATHAPFEVHDGCVEVSLSDGVPDVLRWLLTWSEEHHTELADLEVVRPTMNDVFLGATGCDE